VCADVFVEKLMNVTVRKGEDITFSCRAHSSLVNYTYGLGYKLAGETLEEDFIVNTPPFVGTDPFP